MQILSAKGTPATVECDLMVVPISQNDLLPRRNGPKKGKKTDFALLDEHFSGELSETLIRAGVTGTPGASFLLTTVGPQLPAVLIVVLSDSSDSTFDAVMTYRKLGAAIVSSGKKVGAKRVALLTGAADLSIEQNITALIEGCELSSYKFTHYKTSGEPVYTIEDLIVVGTKINEKSVHHAQELCRATARARDLINLAPNECSPAYLVAVAKEIARKGKLKAQIFDKAQLEKLGAGALLAVAKGSALPPYLIKLTYAPAKKRARTKVISIVGKGVTFDTGGYSIKPADGMIGMSGDMAGAAAVLGAMQYIAAMKPQCEVRAYIPTTENMISGEATRVGDIVKAMNGTTVEILNTDAEGRLILADALTMASRDKADVIIDIATLTGACVVALGLEYAGVFSDDDKLVNDIIAAGAVEGERYWRLPLAPEYKESLKSKLADLRNVTGNRWGGAIIGALFLQNFVTNARWAHIDIAGPSDAASDKDHLTQGGVGFGVRTLARFIMKQ